MAGHRNGTEFGTGLERARERAAEGLARAGIGLDHWYADGLGDAHGDGCPVCGAEGEAGTLSSTSVQSEEGTTGGDMARIGFTGDARIDGLLSGYMWAGDAIAYCAPDSTLDYAAGHPEPFTNFQPLNVDQLAAAHFALEADPLSDLPGAGGFSVESFTGLGVSFLPDGSGAGEIALANTDDPAVAYAWLPDDASHGGDVFFGVKARAPVAGNHNWRATLHEIGHALGLKHGHATRTTHDGITFPALPYEWDSMEFTVMSYRSYVGKSLSTGYSNEIFGHAQTFMMLDILALQEMYGVDWETRGTDTTYSWDPQNGTTLVNGQAAIQPGANRVFMTVWDGGGRDLYDLSAYATDLRVDLAPGGWSVLSTTQLADLDAASSDPARVARGNVFNALQYRGDLRSLIEDALGGSGNDQITGNVVGNALGGGAGNDRLSGGAGADVLTGGAGADALEGGEGRDAAAFGAATVVALDRSLTATGEAAGDSFAGIEDLTGSGFADRLRGDGIGNRLAGGAGADLLEGMGGADSLAGGDGQDTLWGGSGADALDGGAEADLFRWAAVSESVSTGRDRLSGFGLGEDRLSVETIDARTDRKGNQTFLLDGDGRVGIGEIGQSIEAGGLRVWLNNDRDVEADMEFLVEGLDARLGADAFIL